MPAPRNWFPPPAIHHNPQFGYRLVGVLEDEPARCRMIEEFNLPYLGKFDSLEEGLLTRHVVDEVYICLPVRSRYETIQNMAYLAQDFGVSVRMIADLFPCASPPAASTRSTPSPSSRSPPSPRTRRNCSSNA